MSNELEKKIKRARPTIVTKLSRPMGTFQSLLPTRTNLIINRSSKTRYREREREARGAREEREVTTQKSGARATRESKELTGRVSDVQDKN